MEQIKFKRVQLIVSNPHTFMDNIVFLKLFFSVEYWNHGWLIILFFLFKIRY